MKLPYDWIREFAQVDLPPADAARCLTMAGLEVEAVEETAAGAVLDIKVTPNRGDCLSVTGVARELAAACRAPFSGRKAVASSESEPPDAATFTGVTIEAPALCPRYAARVVENLRVGESPGWMQQRLRQAGMRPICNIVDVTNYVMLETGQPLHAFDYNTLCQRRIIVRTARNGETLTTLDGVTRQLREDMLVIADAERPVALAGVMGGADTEISAATRTMLLESAHFDWRSIRRTSKALGLTTEASYRFERGVDPEGVVYAADLACQLIADLGVGAPVPGVVDEYVHRVPEVRLCLRVSRCALLMGYAPSVAEVIEALTCLGFGVRQVDEDTLEVSRPTWRPDVAREVDLVEEVARVLGYERIPERLMRGVTTPAGDSEAGRLRDRVRNILSGAGLQEVVCHTLVPPPEPQWDGTTSEAVPLRNPISTELSHLRWSLVPGLCETAARNIRRGLPGTAIFEVGPVFWRSASGEYSEVDKVAGFLAGPLHPRSWHKQRWDSPLYFVGRGLVERLLDAMKIGGNFVQSHDPRLHPGRQAVVMINGEVAGMLGELHPAYAARQDLRGRCVAFELDMTTLQRAAEHAATRPISQSRFPSVARDLAPRVPLPVPWASVRAILAECLGGILEDMVLVDVYTGSPLPEGYRSFTISLTFRAADRTLTDAEVDMLLADARKRLRQELAAVFQESA